MIMLSDDDFLQGEYDAYCKFCKYANIEPLSVADCRSLYGRTSVDKLAENINFLSKLRDSIDSSKYEAMVLAFCYLCLQGDKAMDENEYYSLLQIYLIFDNIHHHFQYDHNHNIYHLH